MGRGVQRSAQTWWAILQRQRESGLSQAAFCAAEGLSVKSLQNWKRKFVREGRFSKAPPAPGAPWFTELAVPAPEVGAGPKGGPVLPAWQIELELGGGVVLRIHRAGGC
ncbi:MAG: IS66 family insertion sequence element accessory protein TnpA [Pseudarthrobacter sp.]